MSRTIDLRKKVEKKEIIPVVEKASLVDPVRSLARVFGASPKDLGEATSNRIEWEAPSFYHNPQKKYLYLFVILLLFGAGALIFYKQDTLTAIFLALSSFVMVLYANKKPALSKIIVSQAGVSVDDLAYNYRDLKSFWLDYDPHGLKELSLEPKKWYLPYVRISIENQNPAELRSLMIKFVAEKEHERSLVDLVSRKIGL